MATISKHFIQVSIFRKLFGLLIICAVLNSCSLIFEPEETTFSKIENTEQLTEVTNGVYGKLRYVISSSEFFGLNSNADDLYLYTYSASFYHTYYGFYYPPYPCAPIASQYSTSYVYTDLFSVIASINNILVQYNDKNIKQVETNNLLGELYFLRAYCYFRLTRSYGRIPLIVDTDVTYTNELPSFVEIYENIEYDLLKAVELLPEYQCRVDYQTPHQGTAKALLTEVYLSWAGYPVKDQSKYELAASTAAEVIDHASEYQIELLPDFADLWNYNGRYNHESLLNFYCNSEVTSNLYPGIFYLMDINYSGSSSDGFRENPEVEYSNISFWTEVNFFNNYPESYRKDQTFFNHIYVPYFHYWPGMHNRVEVVDTGYIHIEKSEACKWVAFKKFYCDTTQVYEYLYLGRFTSKIHIGNPRICLLRYAQTLLTYAEAAARAGKLDTKAYECVNRIRRRANNVDLDSPSEFDLPPGLTAEAFADSVVQERAWELAGEPEGRWFDLLRLEKIDEVMSSVDPLEDNDWYKKHTLKNFFLPIPKSDLILNPNLGE